MYSKYYKILGLPDKASEKDVKRAYRRLAMRYHPDKSNKVEDHKRFYIILEAYEIITNQRPLPRTKIYKNSPPKPKQKTREEIIRERMEQARARKKRREEKEAYEQEKYFKKLTTGKSYLLFRVFCIINACIALCLLIDKLAPTHQVTGKITQKEYTGMGFVKVTFDSHKISISESVLISMGIANYIEVNYTPIFRSPVDIHPIRGYNGGVFIYDDVEVNTFLTTLINFFPLTQILFLFPLYQWYYKKQSIVYTIAHHTALYFLPTLFILSMIFRFTVY